MIRPPAFQPVHSGQVVAGGLNKLRNLGSGLRSSTYGVNTLNQYNNRTVPGAIDILGIANNAATVTVNSQSTIRKGEYFLQAVSNGSGPVWQSVTVNASNGGSSSNSSGNVFVPQATELFAYDADGNMTYDGRWNYTWDGENRLTKMEALSAVPSGAKRKLERS